MVATLQLKAPKLIVYFVSFTVVIFTILERIYHYMMADLTRVSIRARLRLALSAVTSTVVNLCIKTFPFQGMNLYPEAKNPVFDLKVPVFSKLLSYKVRAEG